MDDYKYVFTSALHKKLKEKIWGGIFVEVNSDDELRVEIIRDSKVDWTFRNKNFTEQFYHGYEPEMAAHEIVVAYKRFVLAKHFC